jgi:penicillin-binding protein 1A
MLEALKDASATAFRMPPGVRLYRVNPSSGLPAGADGRAIYEAYKPGTEPGKNRNFGLQRMPGEERTSERGQGMRLPSAPAGGTGGLY